MNITQRKNNKFLLKNVYVFPGYIFISIDEDIFSWTKINNTYGVSKILVFNHRPAEVSSDIIIQLKNKYKYEDNSFANQNIQKGDNIKVQTGPFVDLIAKVKNVTDNNRIWVLLKYMGRTSKLKLQKTDIIKYN